MDDMRQTAAEVLRQFLECGLPVIEATLPYRLETLPIDERRAVKKDKANCMLAQTCHRQGLTAVLFYRSIAYVMFADRIERFRLPAATSRAITHWDKTGEWVHGSYLLTPPTKSQTRAYKRTNGKGPQNGEPRTVRAHTPIFTIRGSVADMAA